jgi:hypothetical protein
LAIMSTRRKLLAAIPAVAIAAATAQPAFARAPDEPILKPGRSKPSPELRKLIDAHGTAYQAFAKMIRASDVNRTGRA